MDRYELTDGSSAKFWQWEVRGNELIVEYGRIGTKGQANAKSFDSDAAANAAAVKLVKEKTSKGYALVGGVAAPAPKAQVVPKAVEVSRAESSLPWISDSDLAALAATLAKKSKKAPEDIVYAATGDNPVRHPNGGQASKVDATLAGLFDLGLLPARVFGDIAFRLSYASDWLSTEKLVSLAHSDFYPAGAYDYLMVKIGARDAALVAPANDASYPAGVQRILPFARRRLGIGNEPVADDVAREFVRSFLSGAGSFSSWTVRDGRVEPITLSSYDEVKAWVSTIGLGEVWDALVVSEAKSSGFRAIWRATPWLNEAPVSELGTLLAACTGADGAFLFDMLAKRNDPAQALADIAMGMTPGDATGSNREAYRLRETVALVAGARLVAEGREIPAAFDDFIWLLDAAEPRVFNHAYASALRAFPRERVLARVRAFLDAPSENGNALEDPARAPVGLGAHFDEALFERYVSAVNWDQVQDRAAYAGRLGLDVLPKLVARCDAATGTAKTAFVTAIQCMLVGHAERTGEPFAAEYDKWFEPALCREKELWEKAIVLLPQARRDAYMVAWAKLDPFEWQRNLPLCSDEAIDEVIGSMFALRAAKRVHVTYPKGVDFGLLAELLGRVGPRTVPMVKRHYAKNADAKGRELLEAIGLSLAEVGETGAQASTPVAALDESVVATLTKLASDLGEQESEYKIELPTGKILLAESGHAAPKVLGRSSNARSADVLAYYTERDLDGATAGLEAICLRLQTEPVARWEEILQNGSPILDSNVVGLVLADEEAFDEMKDDDRDEVDELIGDNTASGEGVAVHRDAFLALYVGEMASEHRLYWGLDAEGAPSCLVARFVYPE